MKFLLSIVIIMNIALADEVKIYELKIKNHKFDKESIVVEAGKKFKLKITNLDPSSEEFESLSMVVEKFIGPKKTITVTLGPLKKGSYDYFGEFHASSCKGVLISK